MEYPPHSMEALLQEDDEEEEEKISVEPKDKSSPDPESAIGTTAPSLSTSPKKSELAEELAESEWSPMIKTACAHSSVSHQVASLMHQHARRKRADTADQDDSPNCRYPSKLCHQKRALKRNGELHSLCEFHRDKANRNQRKLERKRRAQKAVAKVEQDQEKMNAMAYQAQFCMNGFADLYWNGFQWIPRSASCVGAMDLQLPPLPSLQSGSCYTGGATEHQFAAGFAYNPHAVGSSCSSFTSLSASASGGATASPFQQANRCWTPFSVGNPQVPDTVGMVSHLGATPMQCQPSPVALPPTPLQMPMPFQSSSFASEDQAAAAEDEEDGDTNLIHGFDANDSTSLPTSAHPLTVGVYASGQARYL